MNRFNIKSIKVLCLIGLFSVVSSCKKEMKELTSESQPSGSSDRVLQTMGSGDMVDFNTPNNPYSQAMAEASFGTLASGKVWKPLQANISNQTLKITIPSGSVSNGFYGAFNIAEGTSYEVVFDMKFGPSFDFKEGGKVGFGFGTGDVVTGGNIPTGNGGSVRMMWARGANNKVIFKPYLYYTNMRDAESYPSDPDYHYGTNVKNDAYYPRNGTSLVSNTWYRIKIRITSNYTEDYNGRIQIKVGDLNTQTTILDTYGINWGNSWKRKVFQLLFDTFRGGDDTAEWQSNATNDIYYDNVKFTKDPTGTF